MVRVSALASLGRLCHRLSMAKINGNDAEPAAASWNGVRGRRRRILKTNG